MKCTPILGGFICGSRPRQHRCSSCGDGGAAYQCDYPTKTKSGTCDRRLCGRCAVKIVGTKLDYCPAHYRLSQETQTP